MTDQIKIALAMGAKLDYKDQTIDFLWPDGRRQHNFDPKNDANDCHALIKHLNDEGYSFDITISIESIGSFATIYHIAAGKLGEWQGDNWMHGVCELALKVLK